MNRACGLAARLALLIGLLGCCAAAPPCATDAACVAAGGGTYRFALPPAWNHHDRLKLLMFLHGWRANGSDMIADPAIAGPAARMGFLLVAPDGLDGGWQFGGAPRAGRDDIGFLHAVLADVKRRFPIDDRVVIAAGFSIGGSMVWDLACRSSAGFTAFLPFSGGFWDPMPTSCDSGPVNLRHVHGLADTTMPLAGRAIGARAHQGDILAGMAIWRQTDRCAITPDRRGPEGNLDCQTWSSCAGGHVLQLCLHPGGHTVDAAWLEGGLRWAMAFSATRPPFSR
jgi:polyhydroxybutyrate depolymerase